MDDKIKLTIRCYGVKVSTTMGDEATWRDILDNVLRMINHPGMYYITGDKLIEWANETEYIREEV